MFNEEGSKFVPRNVTIRKRSMTLPQEPRPQIAPALAATPESLEESSYTLLVKAASRLEAELNRVLRPMDLTAATYNILRILRGAGSAGSSCGEISDQLIAEVPDMTRLLDRLEKLGYICRERSQVDRRMVEEAAVARYLELSAPVRA